MQRARSTEYDSGFSYVVFDHDQAYRRVKRSRRFRCLVCIVSPGGSVVVDGEQHQVPASRIVYFEPWRLLFGEAGAVPGYGLPAGTITAIVTKVLRLLRGNDIDDFIAALLAEVSTAVDDLWEFLVDVPCFRLQRANFKQGTSLLYLGTELRLSRDGILFVIRENRRKKYVELLQRYLKRGVLLQPRASKLAGRLNWACNTMFGRCGRAFLSPILARPAAQGGPPRAH